MLKHLLEYSKNSSQQNSAKTGDSQLDALVQAIISCDLGRLETFIREFKNAPNELLPIIEKVGRLINSKELRITGRRFSWKQRGVTRWGVVCELNLVRAQRILLVPTEKEFRCVVLIHNPGSVGVLSCDCPKLMLRQVGKIVGLRRPMSPPPMAFNPQPMRVQHPPNQAVSANCLV